MPLLLSIVMQNNLYHTMFFLLFYLFSRITVCSSVNPNFEACNPATCGNQTIKYPFYIQGRRRSFCGYPGFGLSCSDNGLPILNISNTRYLIQEISYKSQSIRVSEAATSSSNGTSSCVIIPHIHNITLDGTRFSFGPNQSWVFLLFGCNMELLPVGFGKYRVGCWEENETMPVLAMTTGEEGDLRSASEICNGGVVKTRVENNNGPNVNGEALRRGFVLNWMVSSCSLCEETGGKCGFNSSPSVYSFKCYCPDRDHALMCGFQAESKLRKTNLIIGLTTGAVGALLISVIIICLKIKTLRQKTGFWKASGINQNIETFIKDHRPLALTRYKFTDLKKMTNSFEVKLGQGGYGTVYKGKLSDGRLVAVKLLKLSKGNGEEIINEVASISRTSHVNVVTLLGFCLEGHKKALIYEFMSNGSLDKFIHNDKIDKAETSLLTWENLYQIAVGTARGLEYLHKGCNTRILHFDIKPHNILLDENLRPKISDFGLAKLCLKQESIVSITEARGTVGYLAPEVWNRNIGRVSHKSDVYSYGMMLLDMVGGRENMNAENNGTSETYFPDWIYDKLEEGSSLGSDGANNVEGNDIARRMTIVGLWCIQTFPTQRPTISRVIEMLEGSINSLEMPPKPVMSSPPRLELESSSTTNTTVIDYGS